MKELFILYTFFFVDMIAHHTHFLLPFGGRAPLFYHIIQNNISFHLTHYTHTQLLSPSCTHDIDIYKIYTHIYIHIYTMCGTHRATNMLYTYEWKEKNTPSVSFFVSKCTVRFFSLFASFTFFFSFKLFFIYFILLKFFY